MRIEDIMFSLLRSEIGADEVDLTTFGKLSHELYAQLYVLSKKHDLSHLIASALSRMEMLGGDEVSQKFNKQLMVALYRDGQQEYALDQLSTVLESAKIPHIMLKGAVVRNFYPQSWLRTSCDIDVLVRGGDVAIAMEALRHAGYSRTEDCSTHDYNFISPNQVHVELHYTLTHDGKLALADRMLEAVWDRYAVPHAEGSYQYDMKPEAFILYHISHMGRHLVDGGCGIRPFIDLWLIEKNMPFDKDQLRLLLERAGLLTFYEAVTKLRDVWLSGDQHDEGTRNLEAFILTGGAYGTVNNAAKVNVARGSGKIRSFFSIMFLPKKNLQVIYPILVKYPILLPFYQVKRWFNVFRKRKREKVKQIVGLHGDVTQSEADSAKGLLQSLGLQQ